MIINKLDIISFGKFHNKEIVFNDSLNIIVGKNEAGKSTVIDFIYAMLYGFGEKRGTLPFREKCIPWDASFCEGKMSVTLDSGKKVTIYRKTGATKKNDIFQVFDDETGSEIKCRESDIAPVDEDTFLRTLCIKQLSSVIDGSDDEIMQRLSDMSIAGEDGISCDKAEKILKDARRAIRAQRGTGGMLSDLEESEQKLLLDIENDEIRRKNIYITENNLKYEKGVLTNAEKAYKEHDKSNIDIECAELSARIAEKEKYAQMMSPEKKEKKKISPFKHIFAFLSLVCLALCFLNLTFIALEVVLLGICVYLYIKKEPTEQEPAHEVSVQEEIENLRSKLFSLEKKRDEYNIQKEKLYLEYISVQKEVYRLEAQLSELKKAQNTFAGDELAGLLEKKESLTNTLNLINIVIESLEAAKDNMHRSFTPALSSKASGYFSNLTGGKYTKLLSDEGFNITVNDTVPRKSELFSGGTIDQMYFSLRLAITDMLFKDGKVFLILDQPFIQYDSERKERAMKLLENLSTKRQILLFSDAEDAHSGILNL